MLLSALRPCKHLSKLTAVGDDDLGLGGTAGGTVGLDLLDDVKAVDDGAEDDVLAVQPRGLLGADEELGAVAEKDVRNCQDKWRWLHLRVGAGVGHGEDTGASVLQGEVLVPELLAVDGLTTSALLPISLSSMCLMGSNGVLTLPAVKSPPWSMNWGMTRWKEAPLKWRGLPLRPVPFSPVQRARKFSAVYALSGQHMFVANCQLFLMAG